MKKTYASPTVVGYGSIAECTFATPAIGGDPGTSGGGPFECSPEAGTFGTGGKNFVVLQCDKFGEYSHS